MPSEKSRYRSKKVALFEELDYSEAIGILKLQKPAVLAELLWNRADADESLRRQIAIKVLASKLTSTPLESEVTLFLGQLAQLCVFEAEWRESDCGWAQFLDEVATAVEKIDQQKSLAADARIAAIIEAAQESSHQIDNCYSCDIEIERLSKIFSRTHIR